MLQLSLRAWEKISLTRRVCQGHANDILIISRNGGCHRDLRRRRGRERQPLRSAPCATTESATDDSGALLSGGSPPGRSPAPRPRRTTTAEGPTDAHGHPAARFRRKIPTVPAASTNNPMIPRPHVETVGTEPKAVGLQVPVEQALKTSPSIVTWLPGSSSISEPDPRANTSGVHGSLPVAWKFRTRNPGTPSTVTRETSQGAGTSPANSIIESRT